MSYIFSSALSAFLSLSARRMERGFGCALLLEGPPGGGKTSFAKAFAERLGGKCYYYSGSPDKERDLLYEIDVEGVLKREQAWVPGPAWQAFEASARGEPAVLLIDEVDKTNPRFDAFLLRFLEEWTFRSPGGEEVRADPAKLAVVLTSNGRRKLRPEVQRRCQRIFLPLPTNGRLTAIVRQIAGIDIPQGLLELVLRLKDSVKGDQPESTPSPKELALCCVDLLGLAAEGIEDLEVWKEVAASYLTKDPSRQGHLSKVAKFNWARALRTEARQQTPLRVTLAEATA